MDAYSIPEAASLAGVGPRELREAVESGLVPATRRDGRWWLQIEGVEDLRHRLAPPAPALREVTEAEQLSPLERRVEELEARVARLEAHGPGQSGDGRPMRSALTPLFQGPGTDR